MRVAVAVAVAAGLAAVTAAPAPAPAGDAADRPPPWLGVTINDHESWWGGVAVVDVYEDTPAALCGLRPGDEILAVDGIALGRADDLRAVVRSRGVGAGVEVQYVRAGESRRARFAAAGGQAALRRCTTKLAPMVSDPGELLHRRLVDRRLPPFTAVRRGDDTVIDESTARHRVLVLALFTTACDRCAATLAELGALDLAGPSTELVALTAGEPAAVDAYVQRLGVTVPIAIDQDRLVRRYLASEQDVTILVVDHEGVVRFTAAGAGPEGTHLDGAAFAVARAERALRKAR